MRDSAGGGTGLEDGGNGENAIGWIPAGKMTRRGRTEETPVSAEARECGVPSVDAEAVRFKWFDLDMVRPDAPYRDFLALSRNSKDERADVEPFTTSTSTSTTTSN